MAKRKRPPNPLRLDPTRTTTLRKAFLADMRRRFRALRRANRELVDTGDVFGIRADANAERGRTFPDAGATATVVATHPLATIQNTAALTVNVLRRVGGLWYVYSKKGEKLSRGYRSKAAARRRLRQIEYFKAKAPTTNTRWRFETDAGKLDEYRAWLKDQVSAGILEVSGPNQDTPWMEPYINSAYRKGVLRAYTDAHKADIAGAVDDFAFIEGGQEAFLDMAFNSPVAESKLRLLNTRALSHLENVTAEMDKELTRILTDGMASGRGPREMAREMDKAIGTLERGRASAIARTETIHAHAEGQLDAFNLLGVDEVGVMAEWSTAADALVCPMCEPMEGVILSVDEARGLIPRHPNCRCMWIPAAVGEEVGGTTTTQFAGPEQGLEAPGTAPTGQVRGQVWSKSTVEARLRDSIKAEHPRLPARRARAASRWQGADLKKIGKRNRPKTPSGQRGAAASRKRAKATAARKPPTPPPGATLRTITDAATYHAEFVAQAKKARRNNPYRVEAERLGNEREAANERLTQLLLESEEIQERLLNEGVDPVAIFNHPDRAKVAKEAARVFESLEDLEVAAAKASEKARRADLEAYRELLREARSGLAEIAKREGLEDFRETVDTVTSWVRTSELGDASLKDIKGFSFKQEPYPESMTGDVGSYTVFKGGRINPRITVRIRGSASELQNQQTFAHEFGHHLEASIPGFKKKAAAFYKARTKGEKLKKLRGYDCMGREDRFDELDIYAGREYADGRTPEVTSVGMEHIFRDPLYVATKAPDWFQYIMAGLKGLDL